MRARELQANDRTGASRANLLADALSFRKEALGVLMRKRDRRGDAVSCAVPFELLAVVRTPAHPDRTGLLMLRDEAAQRIGSYREQRRGGHIGPRDTPELRAKGREGGVYDRAAKRLEADEH